VFKLLRLLRICKHLNRKCSSREEATGRSAIEACSGAPFLHLFTASEVRAEYLSRQRERSPQQPDGRACPLALSSKLPPRKLTPARLSKKLKIGQEGVSRIEKRTDLNLSTLRDYVKGVGGKLSLLV
jgi:hypothetical protein